MQVMAFIFANKASGTQSVFVLHIKRNNSFHEVP